MRRDELMTGKLLTARVEAKHLTVQVEGFRSAVAGEGHERVITDRERLTVAALLC